MQELPIGIQTFRKMREGNFLYIDKTRSIYELVKKPAGAYFLSRPRRFGKSVLISTLEELFLGNRELFQGLWMDSAEFAWEKHPVLRFDFSKQKVRTSDGLLRFLYTELAYLAETYKVTLETEDYYSQFQELIRKLGKNDKVVILIDEYDKPIIDHLEDSKLAVEMREVLKGFFSVLKGNDAYIRFLLLMGVSKFSKAGVFSNLNHLEDITLRDDFSTLLGITQQELESSFADYMPQLQEKQRLSKTQLLETIKHWYNGYSFSPERESVYNPFSTLLLFQAKRFQHHWFETGTPEFLIKLIIQKQFDIIKIPMQAEEISFSSYEVDDLSLVPLLLQTGYLTIKGYDEELMIYTLDYPNYEVKQAFLTYILRKLKRIELSGSFLYSLIQAVRSNNVDACMETLREVFLAINYDIQIPQEKYYQTIFYLIFTLLGLKIEAEVKTNKGRIDAVVVSESVYLFEFKLNGSKEEALQQIKDKKYYEKYLALGKPIVLVGAEFCERNIGEYVVETLAL
ncbi:MAG: AAA family ATPase [Spirochaetota bacterium]